jgi:RNA polymerase sigma-70 factor, ECF subfamily
MGVPDAADFGAVNEVSRAVSGDRDAFARLILAHKESLYRIALSFLGHEQDVEDAISETILKAFRSIGSLRTPDYFKTWLVRILINECRDALRRRKSQPDGCMIELPVHDKELDRVDLLAVVMQLPDELRAVAVLFYYEDMTGEEIAGLLGLNKVTVRTRLSRARGSLRAMLELEGGI